MPFSQSGFDIRCEWGDKGILQLAPVSDVVIIIDVLSFSTCVDIAVERGALVFPFAGRGNDAADYAHGMEAELAGAGPYALSPSTLLDIPPGARLVLPSPNGSTLSLLTGGVPTLSGCFRNAAAVARAARQFGRRVAVVPAGERWPDASLRPALEDWLAAGAIISRLDGSRSGEASAAVAAFADAAPYLLERLCASGSGRELIQRGRATDVDLAAELDASDAAPLLVDGAYRATGTA